MGSEAFWTGMPGILTALAGLIAAVGTLIGVLHTTGILRKRGSGGAGSEAAPSPQPDATDQASPSATASASAPASIVLRSAPAILSSEKLSAMLVKRGFFDKRRNPAGNAPSSPEEYATRVDGEMLMVVDPATGLTWEMGGSDQEMTFEATRARIDSLNAVRAGGFADWRLPTAEETMSLMQREQLDGLHISPKFRRGTYFVWTSDLLEDGARGWVVYFADGTIEIEPKAFNAWVRAVR